MKPVTTAADFLVLMRGQPKRAGARIKGAVRTGAYASKREATYAQHLAVLKRTGKIVDWVEQVPIKLPGGLKYVCDFMVIESTGVRFVEVKGFVTEVFKLKMKLLEESRPEIFKRLEVVK